MEVSPFLRSRCGTVAGTFGRRGRPLGNFKDVSDVDVPASEEQPGRSWMVGRWMAVGWPLDGPLDPTVEDMNYCCRVNQLVAQRITRLSMIKKLFRWWIFHDIAGTILNYTDGKLFWLRNHHCNDPFIFCNATQWFLKSTLWDVELTRLQSVRRHAADDYWLMIVDN